VSQGPPAYRGPRSNGQHPAGSPPWLAPFGAPVEVLPPDDWPDSGDHVPEQSDNESLVEDRESRQDETSIDAGDGELVPRRPGGPRRGQKGRTGRAGSDLDGFGRFLRQAGQIPLLTHEQEVELAQQMESGSRAAVNTLIEANIRLAVSLAEPLARVTRLPIEDLVQEGTLGLRRAAEKFDWRRGHKFSTYATWWILQAMRRFIAGQRHTLHISSHTHEQIGQMKRTVRRLSRELGRDPNEREIADAMRLPPQRVSALLVLAQDTVPLDVPLGDGADSRPREETIRDTMTPSPEDEAILAERRAHLDEVLSRFLAPRERTVLCLLFGYPSGTPLTFTEVADHFGISPDMVKRIQTAALAKLRGRIVLAMLRDFLEPEVSLENA
jgi:RNA polymerase primary sigma factor